MGNVDGSAAELASSVPGGAELSGLQSDLSTGNYQVRFARDSKDLEAVFRLRFLVFNLELNEGLESSYDEGLDRDAFDNVCDHLLVEHEATGAVVGTYRLQTGTVAATQRGYYSAREFDFSVYERLRGRMLELGRAAIHRDHRSFEVLSLLWRGIAQYAQSRNARYLFGCSSLTSQDAREGSEMYRRLQQYLADPEFRTMPQPDFRMELIEIKDQQPRLQPPRLLRAYLSIGAKICGPPAIDREFKTIDFLTLLDLEQLAASARSRFLGLK